MNKTQSPVLSLLAVTVGEEFPDQTPAPADPAGAGIIAWGNATSEADNVLELIPLLNAEGATATLRIEVGRQDNQGNVVWRTLSKYALVAGTIAHPQGGYACSTITKIVAPDSDLVEVEDGVGAISTDLRGAKRGRVFASTAGGKTATGCNVLWGGY